VKLLIDTHLLLWAAADRLPPQAVPYFSAIENELFFSSASIWEVIIKKEECHHESPRARPQVRKRGVG
jgi:PIN domain nuclease of toxin-antitoxin system